MPSPRPALDALLVSLALVVLDFRVRQVDVLPDPLGYLGAALAALALGRAGFPAGWTALAAACFAAAALLAVPDMLTHAPPPPGIHLRDDPSALVEALPSQVMSAALVALLYALSRHAAPWDSILARHALLAAKTFLILLLLEVLFEVAWYGLDARFLWPLMIPLAFAGLVAFVWAILLLWRARRLVPPMPPAAPEAPSREPI